LTDHETRIELCEPAPAELAVGADFVVRIAVACAQGCDLRGMPVEVIAPDGAIVPAKLSILAEEVCETDDIVLTAPRVAGEHVWRAVVPAQEGAGVGHLRDEVEFRVRAVPLATSLAVWDIPSPVVMGEGFAVKVGAKSSGACALAGRVVEVCDESGAVAARAELGATPLPGTSALYWAPVDLAAPRKEGIATWSVRFAATGLPLPHEHSSSSFSFAVVRAPEHRLTVKIVEKETAAPIADAQIRLGAFRAETDASGLAQVRLPKDTYDVFVWKVGYEAPPTTVDVSGDVAIEVELLVVPEPNPDDMWMM
jgi:hypothetical protein